MIRLLIAAIFFGLTIEASSPSVKMQQCPNGLPNLSARLCPNSTEWDVFADLIVWTAREAGADCWAEVFTFDPSSVSNELREVGFGWDAGFRVGVGYGMEHDQWDTRSYYTWFHTRGTDSVSSKPGTVHSTFLGNFYVDNFSGSGISGPSYQAANIAWTIHFNMFDWELGRNFWVSPSLALRPFVGAKGGWIDQSIQTQWKTPNLTGAEFYPLGTENLKNNFWGLGPQAGLNTQWILYSGCSHHFHLFGDFSGAVLWGHWTFGDLFNNDLQQRISIHLQNINGGATMFRSFMGFGWEAVFQQNPSKFTAKLGYEAQFWLDQLQFYSFVGGRLVNELTLQGGTVEFCFDF